MEGKQEDGRSLTLYLLNERSAAFTPLHQRYFVWFPVVLTLPQNGDGSGLKAARQIQCHLASLGGRRVNFTRHARKFHAQCPRRGIDLVFLLGFCGKGRLASALLKKISNGVDSAHD
jgi:hypothetical protein